MVTILLKTVVAPDFLLWLFFHGFSLWRLTGMFVSNSSSISHCLEGLWKRTDPRTQIDGCILPTAVSFGLGTALHTVQTSNTTDWCCSGSFVVLGGTQYLQKFLSWKTICKKKAKRGELCRELFSISLPPCQGPFTPVLHSPSPSDPHRVLWLFLEEGEKKQSWKVGAKFSKCQHILLPLQGW